MTDPRPRVIGTAELEAVGALERWVRQVPIVFSKGEAAAVLNRVQVKTLEQLAGALGELEAVRSVVALYPVGPPTGKGPTAGALTRDRVQWIVDESVERQDMDIYSPAWFTLVEDQLVAAMADGRRKAEDELLVSIGRMIRAHLEKEPGT